MIICRTISLFIPSRQFHYLEGDLIGEGVEGRHGGGGGHLGVGSLDGVLVIELKTFILFCSRFGEFVASVPLDFRVATSHFIWELSTLLQK